MDFLYKCPVCGTHGKNWENDKEVYKCPKCTSIFSKFGMVVEAEQEIPDFWN